MPSIRLHHLANLEGVVAENLPGLAWAWRAQIGLGVIKWLEPARSGLGLTNWLVGLENVACIEQQYAVAPFTLQCGHCIWEIYSATPRNIEFCRVIEPYTCPLNVVAALRI
jgi:hypothetical protein